MAVIIDREKCIKCGTCKNVCPMGVYDWDEQNNEMKYDNSKCISCGLCINLCPNGAIRFADDEE